MTSAKFFVLLLASFVAAGCLSSPEAKKARFLETGKRQLEKKDYSRAVLEFRSAIRAAPRDAEPYYRLGLTYLATRDFVQAIENLRKASELDPNHKAAQLKLAELMTTSRRKEVLEDAEKRLEQVLTVAPNDADALSALAFAEWRLGQREDAEEHLNRAFLKFPQHLRSLVALAKIKLAKGDMKGAEEILKQAAAQNPPSADAFVALGEFQAQGGKANEAEKNFQRAVELDPANGLALLDLATIQFRAQRPDEADRTFQRLAALPDPRYRPVHASFLLATGKPAEAIAEFEKLVKQNPDDRGIRTRLISAYVSANRVAEAQKFLESVVRKNPKDVEALLQQSWLDLSQGKNDEARAKLRDVLHFNPDSAQAHYLLARVHRAKGEALQQRQELTEVLKLDASFLRARIELSQLFLATNAPKQALEVMHAVSGPQQFAYLIQRNWALLGAGELNELRRGIDMGLKLVKAPDLLLQDAMLKLRLRDVSGARASALLVLQQKPDDERALELLGRSYLAQKQPAEAVRVVRAFAEKNPKSAPVQMFFGKLLTTTGNRKEARNVFLAAKAANPKSVQPELALAELDLADGKPDEARKALVSLLAENRGGPATRVLLASVEEKMRNSAGAMEQYVKILESDPNHLIALNNLAFKLAESGKPDEALKYAERAKELAPENPSVDDTLGWVMYRKGLYSNAVRHLQKAAEKDGTALMKSHLAMALWQAGDEEKGREILQAAVRLDPNLPEVKVAKDLFAAVPAEKAKP